MSLQTLIREQVTLGMSKLGDLLQNVTYKTEGAYNPVTDSQAASTANVFKAVVLEYTDFEKANTNVAAKDRKVICDKSVLTFTIEPSGALVIDDKTYQIGNIIEDPAGATLEIKATR